MYRRYFFAAAFFTLAYGSKHIKPTTIKKYPYHVSISYNGVHSCSGALVSTEWVITSASCVLGKHAGQPTVRAGSTYATEGGSLHQVRNLKIHNFYNKIKKQVIANDVALLRISPPVSIDETRQAIPLFNSNEIVAPNTRARLTGWTYTSSTNPATDQLKRIEEKIINREDCSDFYKLHHNVDLADGQICSGRYEIGLRSVCNADFGGPIVVHGRLAGVVSSAYRCNELWAPVVYTGIAHVREWIRINTEV